MGDLTLQIRALRDTNERYIRAAVRSTQETLSTLNVNPRTYDASGATAAPETVARIFDRNL